VTTVLRKIAPGIVFVGLCTAAISVAAEDGIMLAHRFEAGASQRYRVRFNGEADMHGMMVTQLGDMEVTVKCVSAAEGKYSMEMKFDKAELSRSMMGNMETDPRGETLAGSVVNFVVDGKGVVSGIKTAGYVEVWNELRNVLEPIIKDWYVYLPAEPVVVGGEWSQDNVKETQPGGIEVTKNSRFKLKEMKKEGGRDCALVVATVDNAFGGKVASPGGEFDVSGGGKGKYEFYFDPAAGVVVKYKGKMDVEMEMVPTGGTGDPVESTIGYQFEKELL
jgi:hypothetical protein